jgi:hypothetical protein
MKSAHDQARIVYCQTMGTEVSCLLKEIDTYLGEVYAAKLANKDQKRHVGDRADSIKEEAEKVRKRQWLFNYNGYDDEKREHEFWLSHAVSLQQEASELKKDVDLLDRYCQQ